MLADCAVDIAVNRAYTHQVAWEADQPGTDRKTLHAKASTAKLAASEAAGRVDRPLPADLRRPRLRPLLPGRAHVPRAARGPHLGGHLRDPAPDHRQRTHQARHPGPRLCPPAEPRPRRHTPTPRSEDPMDFRLTPRSGASRPTARALTEFIMTYELECEENNGLSAKAHAAIRDAVLDPGLQAVNMPAEWGGAGPHHPEQAIVQEELGRLTGALWDMVWRPANALRFCTPEQRERFLVPVIKGRAPRLLRGHRAGSGLRPAEPGHHRHQDRRRLGHQRREVVRHGRRPRRLHDRPRRGRAGAGPHPLPRRQGHSGHRDDPRAALHAHLRLRAPRVHLHRRPGGRRRRAGRYRRRLRHHPLLVHRGAADDRRPHDRCGGAGPGAGPRLGRGARAVRRPRSPASS